MACQDIPSGITPVTAPTVTGRVLDPIRIVDTTIDHPLRMVPLVTEDGPQMTRIDDLIRRADEHVTMDTDGNAHVESLIERHLNPAEVDYIRRLAMSYHDRRFPS